MFIYIFGNNNCSSIAVLLLVKYRTLEVNFSVRTLKWAAGQDLSLPMKVLILATLNCRSAACRALIQIQKSRAWNWHRSLIICNNAHTFQCMDMGLAEPTAARQQLLTQGTVSCWWVTITSSMSKWLLSPCGLHHTGIILKTFGLMDWSFRSIIFGLSPWAAGFVD
jgi:hypothetical protein